MPTLLSRAILVLLYHFVPTLLSRFVPALLSCIIYALWFYAVFFLLSQTMLAPVLILDLARKFKQAISDKPLHRYSINLIEPLYPFPPLGLLSHKIECKWDFNTAFITSHPFVSNHDQKKIDLSFARYGCLTVVKLNRA